MCRDEVTMARLPRIGFHASHEQLPPSELLRLVRLAEAAGFDCAMSSDHFRPWGAAQGHSGYAWSWLGAAMASTGRPEQGRTEESSPSGPQWAACLQGACRGVSPERSAANVAEPA
jgi:hypothetical protein